MKKLTLFLPLFLCLSTCEPAYAVGKRAPQLEPSPTPSLVIAAPSGTPVPEFLAAKPCVPGSPCVQVRNITGATPDELPMIIHGVDLANQILATYCYKQWVLSAHYTENNGLTQAQIWDLMVRNPVTVDVEMYTGNWWANHKSRTVGYENDPYDGVTHMNRYFVKTALMVADNLVHEDEGHSQGFRHDFVKATSDPYGQNYAFEGCTHPQEMQARGGRQWRPPGLRLEIRHRKSWKKKAPVHKGFQKWGSSGGT